MKSTPNKKLVVLSNKDQYEHFKKIGYLFSEFQVLSDNPRFFSFLAAQGISFDGIDEFLIAPDLQKINAWASGKMGEWNRLGLEKKIFTEGNWIAAFRHSFVLTFIQIIKNKKLAEIFFERYFPSEIVVFDSEAFKKYPFFSGNICLNGFLSQLAAERGIKIHAHNVSGAEILKGDFPEELPLLKKILRPFKRIAEVLTKFLWTRFGEADFVAFGALKHLAPVMIELKKRGGRVAIYDFEYHGEQLFFALKNRLKYWLPSHFLKRDDAQSQRSWASSQYQEFQNAFQMGREAGLFTLEGYDYGQAIFDHVISSMLEYFVRLSREQMLYQAVHNAKRFSAWIVDEDYAAKGGFAAAFFKAHGINVYCVSHANMTVDFSVLPHQQNFAQSTTFVQSEYEKFMYVNRGWNPEQILVTGIPRYDGIFQTTRRNTSIGKKIRLLHPTGHIWPSSPDLRGYLGCHITNAGDFQAPSLLKIIEAMTGLPIELIIKPHDVGSIMPYKEFVRRTGSKSKIRVVQHSEDFLQLLANCDAVVLSCCSTTLIESAFAHKTVFLVEGKPIPSPALKKLAEMGYCQMFNDVELLHNAFRKLCDTGSSRYFESNPKMREEFYLGYQDGQSTHRVVDFMLAQMSLNVREHCHV